MDNKLKKGHVIGMKLLIAAWAFAVIGLIISYFISESVGLFVTRLGILFGFIGVFYYTTANLKKSNKQETK